MASYKLSKQERLKSKKLIDELFVSGKSTFVHPIKLMYLELSDLDTPLKMSVSVPKRYFKSAVDRNLIKRRIREAYRLNNLALKQKLVDQKRHLVLMLIFVGKEKESYLNIETAVKKLVNRF